MSNIKHKVILLRMILSKYHASYKVCVNVASFDDKKFARRVTHMGLNPVVVVPQ